MEIINKLLKRFFFNFSFLDSIYDFIEEKKRLMNGLDFLGRQSKGLKNKPLFYIYYDGTVEKRIILE